MTTERDRLIALADRLERSTSRGNFNEVVMAAQAAAKALRESAAPSSRAAKVETTEGEIPAQGAAPVPAEPVAWANPEILTTDPEEPDEPWSMTVRSHRTENCPVPLYLHRQDEPSNG